MANVIKSTQGAIFVQRAGPNTRAYYLPETDLDDIEEGKGGIELIQAFDVYGRYTTLGHTQEAPDPIGTTMTTFLREQADELDRLTDCPFGLYVMVRCSGRADVFGNYSRGYLITNAVATSHSRMGLVKRNEDVSSEHSIEIQAYPPVWQIYELNDHRITLATTAAMNHVTFCGEFRCASYCAEPSTVCKDGFAALSAASGATAKVLYTTNGGEDWAQTGAAPFAIDENISSVQCFRMSGTSTRVVVARGTTDGANPAEIAYSDNSGTSWTSVNVGATNGEFINKLFALDLYNIWAVTDGGYIFYSEDGGVTWEAQESGVLTSDPYNDIHFADESYGVAVGDSDVVSVTTDGGQTWSAGGTTGTAGDLTAVFVFGRKRFWVGTSSGELFYTTDYGETFAERSFSGSGAGAVKAMDWINEYIGAVVHNTGASVGRVLFTFNGGYDFTVITTGATAGLNTIFLCDTDLIFTGGAAVSSLTTLYKVTNS